MDISSSAIPLFITASVNLAIAIYVYGRNPRSTPHLALSAMALLSALWATGVAFGIYSRPASVLPVRFTLAIGSLAPLSSLVLAEAFPSGGALRASLPLWLCTPPSLMFFGLAFSSLLVVSVQGTSSGIRIEYGPLHPAYGAYVLLCFGTAIGILGKKHRKASGVLRLQTKYLLIALSIPIVLGTMTNLLVPLVFGTSALSRFGPFFSLIMIGMMGHAIIRHRLMDIRVKVRRGVVYLAAVLVAGIALLSLLMT